MRDLMYAGIVVVVAAATTSRCLGATQHDGAASPPRPPGIILAQAAPKATSPCPRPSRVSQLAICSTQPHWATMPG
jgi:hypothetical protein